MRITAVLFALATSTLLFAQDEKQIQEAIRGLGSESFENREKATADLRKIGAPALDALRKAAEESADPEVRIRAKRLVESISKPPARKAGPGAPSVTGSRVSIRQTPEGSVYALQPPDGDAIEFHRGADGGKVKLVYPDGKGGKAEAEAESTEAFVAQHKELAEKYGITKEGIEYGGTRLSFTAAFPKFPGFGVRPVPMPEFPDLDDLFERSDELRKAFEGLRRWRAVPPEGWGFGFGNDMARGAQLAPVPDVLRSQLAIPDGQGVVVESVREGSTAAAAGLKRHDVILEIDGEKVATSGDVKARLKRDSKVKALRGGQERTLEPMPAPRKDY